MSWRYGRVADSIDRSGELLLAALREMAPEELRAHVATRLEHAGLRGDGFDLEAIVDDLRTRLELDRELDELIGPPPAAEPETEARS